MGKFILICFVVVMVLSFALIGVIYLVRDMVKEIRDAKTDNGR